MKNKEGERNKKRKERKKTGDKTIVNQGSTSVVELVITVIREMRSESANRVHTAHCLDAHLGWV